MYFYVCYNPSCNKRFQAKEKNRKYCSHKCANEIICKEPLRNKKISESNKGRVLSLETRQKISKSQKGKKISVVSIEKMKKTKAMNKKPRSLETGLKISNTLKRKISSGEIIHSQLGKKRPCTEERRKKISESAKKWWRKHKGEKRNIDYKNRKIRNTRRSESEKAWGNYIEKIYDIKLEHSFKLDRFIYDYKYKNFLFEIDGSYWHRNTAERDQTKTCLAEDRGFIIYRFMLDTSREALEIIKYYKNYLDFIFQKKGDLQND